jgi:Leucine-rich repeat (LRR) protein
MIILFNKLELDENCLKSGFKYLKKLQKLEYLSLTKNNISNVKSLTPLIHLKSLKFIYLKNNPIESEKSFNIKILRFLPNVEIDGNIQQKVSQYDIDKKNEDDNDDLDDGVDDDDEDDDDNEEDDVDDDDEDY